MKISKKRLNQIIKEEVRHAIKDGQLDENFLKKLKRGFTDLTGQTMSQNEKVKLQRQMRKLHKKIFREVWNEYHISEFSDEMQYNWDKLYQAMRAADKIQAWPADMGAVVANIMEEMEWWAAQAVEAIEYNRGQEPSDEEVKRARERKADKLMQQVLDRWKAQKSARDPGREDREMRAKVKADAEREEEREWEDSRKGYDWGDRG